jgi:cytochrome c oxidase cbb3-type subunit III
MKAFKLQHIGFAFVILFGFSLSGKAQNGESLFKAKCGVCHIVDKNSTGPVLKGVKQKWEDAGESNLLYDWVRNAEGMIASGKSQMANAIKDFSPSSMTPQDVSNEEIDAIFDYVDNYVKPVATTTIPGSTGENVIIVPDYKENLNLFYWLLALMFILLIAIIIVSNAIITLVKSDYFKGKIQNQKENKNIPTSVIALLVTFGAMVYHSSANALSFTQPGTSPDGTEWLLVEKTDLFILLSINVILLMVLLYLRRMFKTFMEMIRPPQEEKISPSIFEQWNQALTDAVPMEKENEILMDHEYDGIRELDNNLPPWWVWGFFATVVFAVVYLANYHVFKTGDLQEEAYKKEMISAEIEIQAYLDKMAMNVDENSATLMTNSSDLKVGAKLFEVNCVTCHNPKGEGGIGPNLTDQNWIYGYDMKTIFRTIKLGTPNGMPEHTSKLNPIEIQQVSSYLLSLPYTQGKDPEGDIIFEKED